VAGDAKRLMSPISEATVNALIHPNPERPAAGCSDGRRPGAPRDLQLEVVDQPEADVDAAPPRVGDLKAVEQLAAGQPDKSETGQGCSKVISVAWMRFFSIVP
jgi:hypothetical protein